MRKNHPSCELLKMPNQPRVKFSQGRWSSMRKLAPIFPNWKDWATDSEQHETFFSVFISKPKKHFRPD